MIRFHCPKCEREYLLSNALIGVPLLCRGCGDRLAVPATSEPIPEPPKPAFDRSLPSHDDDKPDILVTPTIEDSEVNLFVSAEMRKNLFMPIEGSAQHSTPHPMPPLPSPVAERLPLTPTPPANRKPLTRLADGAGLLVMLLLGASVGSLVARKSSLNILGDSPASPKFPPTDLLLWVGSVAVFGLLYVWLIARGWSLGARLTR